MLRVPTDKAEAGMTIALPVYNPQAVGRVLLKVGYELDRPILRRLSKLHVDHLWVQYPGLAAIERHANPQLLHHRAALVGHVRTAFAQAQKQAVASMQFGEYVQAVASLIDELLAHPSSILFLDQTCEGNQPLMNNSLRVAYLSVLMGLKLDAYLVNQRWRLHPRRAKQVTNLGLGALLHDIGMLNMDPELMRRRSPDQRLDDPRWQQHVHEGYKLVGERVDATARAVVRHHHQHFDGSGFPQADRGDGTVQGIEGTAIHIYARIVCVADVFDRLRHGYAIGQPRPLVEAIGRMLKPPIAPWFDPVVLRAFLRVTPPYPPGTTITLNDGRSAAAIAHHPDDPCRPTVQPLGEAGSADDTSIDLRGHPELHVAAVEDEHVSDLNFPAPDLTHAGKAVV